MQSLIQDLRFGFQILLKKPSFTGIAILTIALGIGANTAIFSVVNSILLRPLPYANPEQLVLVWGKIPTHGLDKLNASVPEFIDYRDRNRVFSNVAVYSSLGQNLTDAGAPIRITATYVSADFFSVLNRSPLYGRTLYKDEDQSGHDPVVILSYSLWQRQFGGDKNVVGQNIQLDGKSHKVIGIMPADFQFPDNTTEVWKPFSFDADDLSVDSRGSHYLNLLARMKPGVDIKQAQADVTSIAEQMQNEHSNFYEEGSGWGATVIGLHEEIVGDVRLLLLVLLGVVGFVLLIACANVANLLLARATSRQREFAIRTALGASRKQLIRQLLIENLLLSITGGTVGTLLALWSKDLLIALSPTSLPHTDFASLDVKVLLFTLAISLFTGLLSGIIPALQATKLNLTEALQESSSKATSSKSQLRNLLVAGEVALALVLLIGAGLMLKSLYQLQRVDLGFNPNNILTMRISLPQSKYAQPTQQHAFFDELINRVEHLPEVNAAGLVNFLPFSGTGNRRNVSVEGKPENPINVEFRLSNPQYFRALHCELRAGRLFDESDRANTPYVAVVNETFVRIFLPEGEPLGKRIRMGGQNSPFPWLTVVGVIKDLKHKDVDAANQPEMYIPYAQPPLPNWNVQSVFLAVKTEKDPLSLLTNIRGIVQEIDKDQPIYSVSTMQALVEGAVTPHRFNMFLMSSFSALALLLAAVGIYGVVSYVVSQRTREIGIRMALGAQSSNVLRMVLWQGMKLVSTGIGIGLLASFALTRLIKNLLFNVSITDPITFITGALILTIVALIACFVPAYQAARTDPMVALRYE